MSRPWTHVPSLFLRFCRLKHEPPTQKAGRGQRLQLTGLCCVLAPESSGPRKQRLEVASAGPWVCSRAQPEWRGERWQGGSEPWAVHRGPGRAQGCQTQEP